MKMRLLSTTVFLVSMISFSVLGAETDKDKLTAVARSEFLKDAEVYDKVDAVPIGDFNVAESNQNELAQLDAEERHNYYRHHSRNNRNNSTNNNDDDELNHEILHPGRRR